MIREWTMFFIGVGVGAGFCLLALLLVYLSLVKWSKEKMLQRRFAKDFNHWLEELD